MNRSVSARKHVYRLTLDAMMIAIFVVLNMVPSEISWASLPILLCAFLIGPVDTVVIALCGSFIEQMWYGLSFYSLIWMLPWLAFSLFVGLLAFAIRKNERIWKLIPIVVCGEILLNVANTLALCYFGYVSIDFSAAPHLVLWAFILRMPQALIRATLSSVVVPLLLPPLRRVLAKIYR